MPISEDITAQKYILEINSSNQLQAEPWTKEKIEKFTNPGDLKSQELLHQAITNNSSEDIKEAIKLGANLDMGVGDQPPLLLAVITDKQKAVEELLNQGANPNISYQDKPLVMYLIKRWNLKLAQAFFNKEFHLSSLEKKEVADYILYNSPYQLDQYALKILELVNYPIRDNFKNNDLSKNKWYSLLKNNLGRLGLIDLNILDLFLKNGADPNQIFILPNRLQWNPILLVMNWYFEAKKKGGINAAAYQDHTLKVLEALLKAGGNVNMKLDPISANIDESPLSFALKYDEQGKIIDFLVKNAASVEEGVDLFLKSGGAANKKIKYPNKNEQYSLLWWAVEKNNLKAVQLLVNAGLKDDAALKLAISKGYSNIIKTIMEKQQ